MSKQYSSIVFLCGSFLILASILCDAIDDGRKTYIVYMGSLPEKSSYSPTSHHLSILQQVIKNGGEDDDGASGWLVHSYKRSFNGFAAKLTEEEKEKIAQMKEVVSVFPSVTLEAHTTRSWDFIGFHESIKRQPAAESDVIIGVIDTGIWPASDSFSDHGFGPVPKKWKGTCGGGKNFTCNNKIIGARFYVGDSAIDKDGHGTHTTSIAAGNQVEDASFYGLAQGTARGAVPSSRIAAYKVCNPSACDEATVLAAFDDAITDGVDILSVSLGGPPTDFTADAISIGSFHAMAKGILTVNSAGNNGPDPSTVSSVSPWLFSVASSTIDRGIVDKVVLGNGKTLTGTSVNSFASNGTKFPIALKNGDSEKCPKADADDCECLDPSLVKGKIVLCPNPDGEEVAFSAGAIGTITGDYDLVGNVPLVTSSPSLSLDSSDYNLVRSYTRSTKDPKAEILKSEAVEDDTAPAVANFSSRGPNSIVAEILKPDIAAPGVGILAAFSSIASPSGDHGDKRSVKYNILTGTSMACPHVTGISAYVKTFHPDWSPAAIKSAIMTTAKPMNNIATNDDEDNNNNVGEFAYGSGHVNPVQAVDPGLIYDLSKQDYIQMLCNLGYDLSTIKKISGDKSITCQGSNDRSFVRNTNYPSLGITVPIMQPFNVKINRTVTNVGSANSNYKVTVSPNSKLTSIKVEPQTLSFRSLNEKQSFVVTIVGEKLPKARVITSSLVWSDGTHNVRSPILVIAN